jgi:hypothetical protein
MRDDRAASKPHGQWGPRRDCVMRHMTFDCADNKKKPGDARLFPRL